MQMEGDMADYVLSCCSVTGMGKEWYEEQGIRHISLRYEFDGEYFDDEPELFNEKEFYEKLEASKSAATHVRSVDEYVDYFKELVKDGGAVVHISLSSGISDAFNRASGAAAILKAVYPDTQIRVIDSLCAADGVTLLLEEAVRLRDEGTGMEELVSWIEANRLKVNHLFFSSDLSQFIKTGSLPPAAGRIAKRHEICPVMEVNSWGELVRKTAVASKEKVMKRIVKYMKHLADGKKHYGGRIILCQSECMDDAEELLKMISEALPDIGETTINPIGATIGLHTGRGTVAVFFWGKERTV